MYESPISEMLGKIQTKIIKQQGNRVIQAVQNCGISVDKEELTKALMYDRHQYEKGYADAKKIYERKKGKWIPERLQCTNGGSYQVYRCDQCQEAFNWRMDFCGGCGADMRGGDTNGSD